MTDFFYYYFYFFSGFVHTSNLTNSHHVWIVANEMLHRFPSLFGQRNEKP